MCLIRNLTTLDSEQSSYHNYASVIWKAHLCGIGKVTGMNEENKLL